MKFPYVIYTSAQRKFNSYNLINNKLFLFSIHIILQFIGKSVKNYAPPLKEHNKNFK